MKKLIATFLITIAAGAASVAQAAEKVTVFAAASMKDMIEEAARADQGQRWHGSCGFLCLLIRPRQTDPSRVLRRRYLFPPISTGWIMSKRLASSTRPRARSLPETRW